MASRSNLVILDLNGQRQMYDVRKPRGSSQEGRPLNLLICSEGEFSRLCREDKHVQKCQREGSLEHVSKLTGWAGCAVLVCFSAEARRLPTIRAFGPGRSIGWQDQDGRRVYLADGYTVEVGVGVRYSCSDRAGNAFQIGPAASFPPTFAAPPLPSTSAAGCSGQGGKGPATVQLPDAVSGDDDGEKLPDAASGDDDGENDDDEDGPRVVAQGSVKRKMSPSEADVYDANRHVVLVQQMEDHLSSHGLTLAQVAEVAFTSRPWPRLDFSIWLRPSSGGRGIMSAARASELDALSAAYLDGEASARVISAAAAAAASHAATVAERTYEVVPRPKKGLLIDLHEAHKGPLLPLLPEKIGVGSLVWKRNEPAAWSDGLYEGSLRVAVGSDYAAIIVQRLQSDEEMCRVDVRHTIEADIVRRRGNVVFIVNPAESRSGDESHDCGVGLVCSDANTATTLLERLFLELGLALPLTGVNQKTPRGISDAQSRMRMRQLMMKERAARVV